MGLFARWRAEKELALAVSHPLTGPTFTRQQVEALLAKGANPMVRLPEDFTLLDHAAVWGNVEVAEALLRGGANPEGGPRSVRKPLHIAAQNGHSHLVTTLVDFNVNLDAQDSAGRTAVHYAVSMDSGLESRMPELLISLGADPRIRDARGRTALDEFRESFDLLMGVSPQGSGIDRTRMASDMERLNTLLG